MSAVAGVLDPSLISPSRLSRYSECGLAFRTSYVEGIKPRGISSRQLFGNIVHKANEVWCLDRSQPYVPLIEAAWDEVGREDPALGFFLRRYRAITEEAREVEAAIRQRRPDIKAVRSTKDWKQSAVGAKIAEINERAIELLADSIYTFDTGDPLPKLYDESLRQGAKYAERWRNLPDALYSEIGFKVEWRGFTLQGRIDEVLPIVDRWGEFKGYGILDGKTEGAEPDGHKHLNQLVMYQIGVPELIEREVIQLERGAQFYVGIDFWRLLKHHWYVVDAIAYQRLYEELCQYRTAVTEGIFLPAARSQSCRMCDFKAECQEYHGPRRAEHIEAFLRDVAAAA